MKRLFCTLLTLVLVFLFVSDAYAVHVNGYYRKNGTYVNGYERTAPDGNPYNNYSYPGNYNPNTGSITGGNPSTYLNNYYKTSSYSSAANDSYFAPLCPSNSYYDGVSSCKCKYGYTASGSSCVSLDSICHSQTGYSSSYDSSSNSCKCDYGSVLDSSGKCTDANYVCSQKIGLMSQYNSLTNKCECMMGYEFNGTSCTYVSKSSAYLSNSCPANSHESLVDPTMCTCNTGYQINSLKTACVAMTKQSAASTFKCPVGYICKPNTK